MSSFFALKSSLQLANVVKPKPNQTQWPITEKVNNTMNQSKLEANIRHRCRARENACSQDAIGFGLFASDWLSKRRELFKLSSRSERTESKA